MKSRLFRKLHILLAAGVLAASTNVFAMPKAAESADDPVTFSADVARPSLAKKQAKPQSKAKPVKAAKKKTAPSKKSKVVRKPK